MSENLAWEKMNGLIPAVIQDADSRQVLMVGYMNEASLAATRASGKVTFFSRSKNRLWQKGETSGNVLNVVEITSDCDADALLIEVSGAGPCCHRSTTSCFGEVEAPGLGLLAKLCKLLENRFQLRPRDSYTTSLFESGIDRMAQKVGEEGIEVVIAAKNNETSLLLGEAADLLFHLMVLLTARRTTLKEVVSVLRSRHGK